MRSFDLFLRLSSGLHEFCTVMNVLTPSFCRGRVYTCAPQEYERSFARSMCIQSEMPKRERLRRYEDMKILSWTKSRGSKDPRRCAGKKGLQFPSQCLQISPNCADISFFGIGRDWPDIVFNGVSDFQKFCSFRIFLRGMYLIRGIRDVANEENKHEKPVIF